MPRGGITTDDVAHALFSWTRILVISTGLFGRCPLNSGGTSFSPLALWLWTASPCVSHCPCGTDVRRPVHLSGKHRSFVLPAFLLGIVAAHLRLYERRWERWALPLAFLLVPLAYLQSPGFITPLWALAMFAVVVSVGSFRVFEMVLSFRGLTVIGLASYSIYLIHQPVILFCEARGIGPWLALFVSLLAGFAFWAAAERPFVETALRVRMLSESAASSKSGRYGYVSSQFCVSESHLSERPRPHNLAPGAASERRSNPLP